MEEKATICLKYIYIFNVFYDSFTYLSIHIKITVIYFIDFTDKTQKKRIQTYI